ncbi:acyl carrier protein [Thermoanaerobacteraceae bacterium SP2]|nr:acyl carrier protein [Thermoanaerobacteraceae bacterium SP2]
MKELRLLMEKVLNVDLNNYKYEEITPSNIDKWDSFAHLNLVIAIEEEYGVELSPDDIQEMKNGYNSIIKILNKYGVLE